jgi:hypothetical protein
MKWGRYSRRLSRSGKGAGRCSTLRRWPDRDPFWNSTGNESTSQTVTVFAIVAAVQLIRILLNWAVVINGVPIPIWVSGIACVVAIALAVMVGNESRR